MHATSSTWGLFLFPFLPACGTSRAASAVYRLEDSDGSCNLQMGSPSPNYWSTGPVMDAAGFVAGDETVE